MNKKLFLHSTAIIMASMLCVSFSSCKNSGNQSDNNVEEYSDVDDNYTDDDFNPEEDYAPGEDGYDSDSRTSSYGNWTLSYSVDDFGEKNYSYPFIGLILTHESNNEDRSGSYVITIRVFKVNGNLGLSFQYATYPGFGDYIFAHPYPIVFRTEQGDYNLTDVNVEGDEAYCKNTEDFSYVINLLKRGHFKIKVGTGIYNVTNETDGFTDAFNDHLMNQR